METRTKRSKTPKPSPKPTPKKERHPRKEMFERLGDTVLKDKQKSFLEVFQNNDVVICIGPAGTSKTFISCYSALKELAASKYHRIILTKPMEESGEKMGFLPGDVEEKMNPYYESYTVTLNKLITRPKVEDLFNEEALEYRPLSFMRGATFDESIMILDEAQNCDVRQLILFVTRMGRNSKVVILGDVTQTDIDPRSSGISFFIEMLKEIPRIGVFEFSREDIVRNPLLVQITDRYEAAQSKGVLPKNKKG